MQLQADVSRKAFQKSPERVAAKNAWFGSGVLEISDMMDLPVVTVFWR